MLLPRLPVYVMPGDRPPADGTWTPAHTGPSGRVGDREQGPDDRCSAVADGGIGIGKVIEALADERRRCVLYYLQDRGNAELEDVIEHVAAREAETAPDEIDDRLRTNVRIGLYHADLPKLDDAGIIGYDRRKGTMCLQYLPDPVEQFLEYCETVESP